MFPVPVLIPTVEQLSTIGALQQNNVLQILDFSYLLSIRVVVSFGQQAARFYYFGPQSTVPSLSQSVQLFLSLNLSTVSPIHPACSV